MTPGRAARRRHAAIGFASVIGALVVGAASGAGATVMDVVATLTVEYGTTAPLYMSGVGVVTVNPSGGGDRLISLQVGPIYFGDSDSVLFTDPNVNALVKSYDLRGVSAQSGFFFDLSHAATSPAKLTQNTLPISGIARICLLFSGCLSTTTVEVDLSQNGTRGIGIGGTITAGNTTGFRVSFHHAPWQLAPATLDQSTVGGIITAMATGYARGPLSNTSTAAKAGGSIQLIAPTQVFTEGVPGGYSDTQALFTRLTLNFVPEPAAMLLLGPGVVSLVLLGRRRMRR
ncbi:MAG: hypothetical protein JRF15_09100 [Deltaproteobacteria bacterium]|nr:hypothetical protein [Deltaproteobacteria bacterium]